MVNPVRCPVRRVLYYVHQKKDSAWNAPRTMRVEYEIGDHEYQREWICFEHTGFARDKAERWWRTRRGDENAEVPKTAHEAVNLAKEGILLQTESIHVLYVDDDEPFGKITGYELSAYIEKTRGLDLVIERVMEALTSRGYSVWEAKNMIDRISKVKKQIDKNGEEIQW